MARILLLLARVLAGLIALAVIVLALLAARLSAGPVSLHAYTPSIARLLDAVTPFRFTVGDAGLLWRNWQRGLLVHLSDVQASGDDGAVRGHIDQLAVAFSPAAMTRGVIAPTSVEATGGTITLSPAIAGAKPADDEAANAELRDLLAGLRSPPRADRPLSWLQQAHLQDLTIAPAAGAFDGWSIRIEQARFERSTAVGLTGDASLTLVRADQRATVALALTPAPSGDALRAALDIAGVRPAAFAGLDESLAVLEAVDVPLHGRATLDLADDGAIANAEVALTGGSGALTLTKQAARAAGLPAGAAQRLPVRSLAVQSSGVPAHGQYTLTSAEVAFAPGAVLIVPAPVDHRFPLVSLTASGALDGERLQVSALTLDLGGPRIVAAADVRGLPEAPAGTVDVTVNGLQVNNFRRYWPPKLAPGAYDWCTKHLRDGRIPEARARLTLAGGEAGIEITSLTGDFGVERLTVDYLPPMPAVRNAAGTARFDLKTLRIEVRSGQALEQSIRGTIVFPDLDRDLPSIHLDLSVNGPVRSAMTVIASEPLAYLQKMGLSPAQFSGRASTRVRLAFPLLADLPVERMDIQADSTLQDFGIADVADGVNVTDGQLQMNLDGHGMRTTGVLAVAGVEGRLNWSESFVEAVEPQTLLEFEADQVPVARLRSGLAEVADLDEYLLGGSLAGRVRVVVGDDGTGTIDASGDLRMARLAVPPLNWSKPAGSAGTLEVAVRTAGKRIAGIPRLALTAPDLQVAGSVHLGPEGRLDHLNVDRLASGRTDVQAMVARLDGGGWDIMISGSGVDIGPLLAGSGEEAEGSGTRFAKWPHFTLAADLGTIWLGAADPIRAVMARVVHEGEIWRLVQMQGALQDGSEVELSIAPTDGAARRLTLSAGNAGEALRAFRLFPDIRGGRLHAEGVFDDLDPTHPLSGRLRVRSYHLVNAPILARLLGVLALTGIRDALTGQGVFFSNLNMPFRARRGVIDIENGIAYGSALGITASGSLDARADAIDLRGELVPFYAVNSALGRLPLLGDIMIGGEDGGGVFSASYRVSGPLADPQISVNPVTVLFPGFLRWILETFQGWLGGATSVDQGVADGPEGG